MRLVCSCCSISFGPASVGHLEIREVSVKAAAWNANGSLDVLETERPEPGAGWARLAVAACGICGSDLHGFRQGRGGRPGHQPGHEVAGYLDGPVEGTDLEEGRLYALEPIDSCNDCSFCGTGHYNLCRSRRLIGGGAPGGLAEKILVPAHRLYALPDGFDRNLAALSEPLAVCVRGVRLGNVGYRGTVAVIGAGSIGLLCIPAALAAGAKEVFITARHSQQAELAYHLGATRVFDSTEALLDGLGDGYAATVIETVGGTADTLLDAATIAAPGATIVKLGIFTGNTPIPSIVFFNKELTLVASNCYAFDGQQSDFAYTQELLTELGEKLEPLITHKFALDQVNEAFATALDKTTGSIKVQISP